MDSKQIYITIAKILKSFDRRSNLEGTTSYSSELNEEVKYTITNRCKFVVGKRGGGGGGDEDGHIIGHVRCSGDVDASHVWMKTSSHLPAHYDSVNVSPLMETDYEQKNCGDCGCHKFPPD